MRIRAERPSSSSVANWLSKVGPWASRQRMSGSPMPVVRASRRRRRATAGLAVLRMTTRSCRLRALRKGEQTAW